MAHVRRAAIALLCATCCILSFSAASAPAQSTRHPALGIGDENLFMFRDPRFLSLGIKEVRFDMSWDVLSGAYKNHYRRDILEAWLGEARADGLTPLITFDHSDRRGQAQRLPSVAQFSRAFRQFRQRYPWVKQFVTWDEANYYGEAIAQHPKLAAEYYLALRRDCPHCTIAAADLLDITNRRQAVPEVQWARELMRYAHARPSFWALNNYVGANDLSLRSLKRVLRGLPGSFWLAETGGIISLPHRGKPGFPLTPAHAATVDRFLLTKVAALSPRIKRIYLYEWRRPSAHSGWDSALIAYNNVPRRAYKVLANTLDAWGITPNCALSLVPPACKGSTGATGASGSTGATAASATGS